MTDTAPCKYANGRHDFRKPMADGTYRCSAPGCWATGKPPWLTTTDPAPAPQPTEEPT